MDWVGIALDYKDAWGLRKGDPVACYALDATTASTEPAPLDEPGQFITGLGFARVIEGGAPMTPTTGKGAGRWTEVQLQRAVRDLIAMNPEYAAGHIIYWVDAVDLVCERNDLQDWFADKGGL